MMAARNRGMRLPAHAATVAITRGGRAGREPSRPHRPCHVRARWSLPAGGSGAQPFLRGLRAGRLSTTRHAHKMESVPP